MENDMAKKRKMTPEQERILRREGLDPRMWVVLQDYMLTMLIRNPHTGEYRSINKKQTPF